MHLILERISYYRQRVGTNGCTAWLDNFPSFVFVSLLVFIVIVTCQRFSSSLFILFFLFFHFFSTIRSRQKPQSSRRYCRSPAPFDNPEYESLLGSLLLVLYHYFSKFCYILGVLFQFGYLFCCRL